MSRAWLCLPLALLLACPGERGDADASSTGDTSTMTSATDGDVTSTTEAMATAGETSADETTASETSAGEACEPPQTSTGDCCCFEHYEDTVFIENLCPEESPCPPIVITCSWDDAECPVPEGFNGPPDVFEVDDEAGLDCVLEALRDGTPGTLTWTFQELITPGQYERGVIQHIAADRVVFATAEDLADQSGAVDDVTQQALQPAEYFSDCLAETDLRARALCLTNTTNGSITATCEMGGTYSNF